MTKPIPGKAIKIHLRTILMAMNLMVFLLPLVGVIFFRVYENTLIQQTETELISQAAVVAAAYKLELEKQIENPKEYGNEVRSENLSNIEEYYKPVLPKLDFSKTKILPPRGDGFKGKEADPIGIKVSKTISPLIIESQKTTLSGIKILDYNGVSVAGRAELQLDFSYLPEIQKAMVGHYESVLRVRISDSPPPALASISRGTGVRVFIAFPIIKNNRVWGIVYLSRTPQNILKHMYSEKWHVIFVISSLLILSLIIALITSYFISRPIKQLVNKTERFAKGDITALENKENTTHNLHEISLLSDSFSNMAKALNNRTEYIRDFAMHLSHEFKTPITSIQGSAELLLDNLDQMENEKKQKFLSNIITDSNRIKQLITRLLELARADNITVTDETCSMRDLFKTLEKRYKNTKNFKLTLPEQSDWKVKISLENLETVFINLCDNAYQNEANEIRVEEKTIENKLEITLTDNGKGISKANAEKIFTPFFTTRRNNGGTGMGLGIVLSLLKAHNGTIRLIPSNKDVEKRTRFLITLDLATN